MKYIFFFVLSCFSYPLFAQNAPKTAIDFQSGNLKNALEEAQKTGKIVFLDAYTTWCGPCKMMNRTVFADDSVGRFFNDNFINVKLDMENEEGVTVAQRLGVRAYPTLLFLDSDGNALHRSVGAILENAEFLALGKTALDQNSRLSALDTRYAQGQRDTAFLRKYTQQLISTIDPRRVEVLEAYMAAQTSPLDNETTLRLIFQALDGVESSPFRYVVLNRSKFYKALGEQTVETTVQDLVGNALFNEKRLPTLGYADTLLALAFGQEKAPRISANYRLRHARMRGDRVGYADAAVAYFAQYDDRAEELCETAQTFSEVIDDKKMLKKALSWAKKGAKILKSPEALLIVGLVH